MSRTLHLQVFVLGYIQQIVSLGHLKGVLIAVLVDKGDVQPVRTSQRRLLYLGGKTDSSPFFGGVRWLCACVAEAENLSRPRAKAVVSIVGCRQGVLGVVKPRCALGEAMTHDDILAEADDDMAWHCAGCLHCRDEARTMGRMVADMTRRCRQCVLDPDNPGRGSGL